MLKYVLIGLISSLPAIADTTSYSRSDFESTINTSQLSLQDFDDLIAGTELNSLDGVTYSASEGAPFITEDFGKTTDPNALASSPVGFFAPTETATFVFDVPINTFAIDINTFAELNGEFVASLNTGDTVLSLFDPFPGTTTGQFIGFTSDTLFTSVTLSTSNPDASYTLDTMFYGDFQASVIPSPSAVLAVIPMLTILGLRRGRRNTGVRQ